MAQGLDQVNDAQLEMGFDTHASMLVHGLLVETMAVTAQAAGLGSPQVQVLHVAGGASRSVVPPRTRLLVPVGHVLWSSPASGVRAS
jgi:hypothetical protein